MPPSGTVLEKAFLAMSEPRRNRPVVDPDEILAGIERWVRMETPTSDARAVDALGDTVAAELAGAGAAVTRVPGRDGFGGILKARSPWGGDGPGILVLAHLDTVHPHGTIARNALRREGDKVYGPGTYDMKGGAYLASYAFRHLAASGEGGPLPVTILFMPDEEVGSPTSRALIEEEGRAAKHVLVVEPARDGGKVVTGRKGSARYVLTAHGCPAHSGSKHRDGRSAIREIARKIVFLEGLTDYERDVTVNVGLVEGGSAVNVVPEHATARFDVRLPDMAAADEVCGLIEGMAADDPDVTLTLTGGLNRPPYAKDERGAALFERARAAAAEVGIDLADTRAGGGSDGNFTAALGIPTLDGLGVDGDGAHTEWEHMLYSSLAPRAELLIRLMRTLD